jgi:uncharacterized cupredoxin-like copper-binding protein
MNAMMTSILKVSAVALLALALLAFIAGCNSSSGSDDDTTSGAGDEVAEHVDDENADDAEEHADDADNHDDADEHTDADEHEGGDTVHVSLSEWGISPAHGEAFEAQAGEMVFEIHNDGAAPHDLKVIKTDLAPDALPIADGVVDQEAAGEIIGGVDPIPSGDIYVEPYDLDAGSYVIICTIPGHYQQGMQAELTVQ